MQTTDKLIICVAPTGDMIPKQANPNLPEQPDEIAEEVYRCWNEGAAIVHIHARDKDGKALPDPDLFREIDRRIREKGCDIIIQHSTAPGPRSGLTVEDGTRSVEAGPEMASLSMGVATAIFPGGEEEMNMLWTRRFQEKTAKLMLERGVKPEMEIYNPAMMENVLNLINKGLLKKPYWLSFVMGMEGVNQNAIRYTPRNLMNYLDILPQDAMFSVLGIARNELPATTLSILLGGHVRVGLEDNIHYSRGVLATNLKLVERIARLGREFGRQIASPAEARELLGIPKLP